MYAGDGVGGGRGGGGNNRSSRNNHGFRDSVIRRATTRDLPEEGIIVEGTELQAPTPWHHRTNVAEQALAPGRNKEGIERAMAQMEVMLPLELCQAL